MKILVISDIHGRRGLLSKYVNRIKPDYIFFLGDGLNILNDELKGFEQDKIFKVRGNADLSRKAPTVLKVKLGGVNFLLTHGHGFNVKSGLTELYDLAKKEEVNMVCFGHTHKNFNQSINNIKFLNPGTFGSSRGDENSYAVLEIEGKKITQKIEKI